MSTLKTRLKKLEEKAEPVGTIVMMQDLNDRELFWSGGREYREGSDNWPDATKIRIVRVVFVDDWKNL